MTIEISAPPENVSPAASTSILHRYRLTYRRGPEMRYVGHLDTQLVWERTMRRTRLPLAFSQGFNPRPRFHMASALPLGFTSLCELADMWLNQMIEPEELIEKLQKAAPPGLTINTIVEIDLALPALQTQVQSAEFIVQLLEQPQDYDLQAAVQRLLSATHLPRIRRDKPYDLRPLIDDLCILPARSSHELAPIKMQLSAREGATGRPDEVLAEMGLDAAMSRVERTGLVLA